MSFPVTKFVIPRLRGDMVDRAELVRTLAGDIHAVPLTVLHAPAGYGKTTLAAMAATTMDGVVAWLSVDPDDNSPHRFLAGLAAALGPELAGPAEAVLGDRGPDVVRRAATALLNVIGGASTDVVVVLDEWELVTEPAVHAQLEFLVTWAPPNLHLVVATRHEPPVGLPRLRARGQLAERGPRDLRFTGPETEKLLTGLGLPATDVTAAHRRTEGWPAGLRLLATARGQAALPPTSDDSSVFAFLADEVFSRELPEIRRFLVETSVLTTLSAQACVLVTGRDDAADVLAELAGRGLFLTERGGVDEYRYHQLFGGFLRWQLARWPTGERVALHRRAALAETDPVGVARHLADAGEVDAAADLLADNGPELLRAGRGSSVRALLDRLPATDRPELLVLTGDLAFAAGDLAAARHAFERAGPVGPVAARLADCLILQGDITAADELLGRALTEPQNPQLHIRLQITRAQVAQILGRFDIAEQALGAAVDTAVESEVGTIAATTAQLSPALCLIRGGVDHLERFADLAGQVLPDGLARLSADGIVASVDLVRGRLDKARATARRVRAEYERFGGAPPLLGFTLAATHLMAAGAATSGGLDEPIRELLHYADLLTKASFLYPNAWFLIGRARWLRGQYDGLRRARARMGARVDAPAGSASIIAINRLTLDGLISAIEGSDRRAEELLRAAVGEEDETPLVNVYGSARVRLAWFYADRGRPDDALAAVRPALAECERAGLAGRVLVEGRAAVPVLRIAAAGSVFAAALLRRLDAVTAPHAVAVPQFAEGLTAREAEVLRMLADGATNRQIARDLVLGEETVKTHVSRVLRKLDVRTRTAAATRARELGLLS